MKKIIQSQVQGFFTFVREQGVVGLAIGFILGGSVSGLVSSLVTDIIQPMIGLLFGSADGLAAMSYGPIMYGKFLAKSIDFLIIAGVVYFGFKGLKLDQIDLKKDAK